MPVPSKSSPELPTVISVEQAAQQLGLGIRTAYKRVHDGTLPSVRIGTRIVIPTHRFRAFLNGE